MPSENARKQGSIQCDLLKAVRDLEICDRVYNLSKISKMNIIVWSSGIWAQE